MDAVTAKPTTSDDRAIIAHGTRRKRLKYGTEASLTQTTKQADRIERARKALELAKKLLEEHSKGAESFLLTFHVVKEGRITHYFDYEDFPSADFGACMIAMGTE